MPQIYECIETHQTLFWGYGEKGLVKQSLSEREITSYPFTPWARSSKSIPPYNPNASV